MSLCLGKSEANNNYFTKKQVLEVGIIVHSVVIGISLGASQNPDTAKALFAALMFHQCCEGLGLGGCIAQVPILPSFVFSSP